MNEFANIHLSSKKKMKKMIFIECRHLIQAFFFCVKIMKKMIFIEFGHHIQVSFCVKIEVSKLAPDLVYGIYFGILHSVTMLIIFCLHHQEESQLITETLSNFVKTLQKSFYSCLFWKFSNQKEIRISILSTKKCMQKKTLFEQND